VAQPVYGINPFRGAYGNSAQRREYIDRAWKITENQLAAGQDAGKRQYAIEYANWFHESIERSGRLRETNAERIWRASD